MKAVEIEIVVTPQQARAIADMLEVGSCECGDDETYEMVDGLTTELRAAASGDPKLSYQFTSTAAKALL